MKFQKWMLVASAFALAGCVAVFAAGKTEKTGAPPKRASGEKAERPIKDGSVLAKWKTDLGLSDGQVAKIQPILTQRKAALSANTKNHDLTAEQTREAEKKIRDDANAKIRVLLNADQQRKFDEYNAKLAANAAKRDAEKTGEKKNTSAE